MKSRTALIGLFIIILRIESAAGPERASELQCPAAKKARTGETETLRFLMKPGIDVYKDLTVECLYRDADSDSGGEFYVFRQGEEDVNSQDERFKGKTVLSLEEPPSKNFSLKMTVDHAGTYCCTVYNVIEKSNCSTTLTVRAREQDPVTPSNLPDGDGKSDPETRSMDAATIGGIIAIIAIIAIIGVIAIIFYCKPAASPPPPPPGANPAELQENQDMFLKLLEEGREARENQKQD